MPQRKLLGVYLVAQNVALLESHNLAMVEVQIRATYGGPGDFLYRLQAISWWYPFEVTSTDGVTHNNNIVRVDDVRNPSLDDPDIVRAEPGESFHGPLRACFVALSACGDDSWVRAKGLREVYA